MLTIVWIMSGSGNRTIGVTKMINRRHQRLTTVLRRAFVIIILSYYPLDLGSFIPIKLANH